MSVSSVRTRGRAFSKWIAELLKSHLRRDAARIVTPDNSRSNPRGYVDMQMFEEPVLAALELPDRRSVGHLVIEPVFDDFGDLIGALSAIRILKSDGIDT